MADRRMWRIRPDLTVETFGRLPRVGGDKCPAHAWYIYSNENGGRILLRERDGDMNKAHRFFHEMIHRLLPDGMDKQVEEATCEQGSAEIMDALADCAPLLRGVNEYAKQRRGKTKGRG